MTPPRSKLTRRKGALNAAISFDLERITFTSITTQKRKFYRVEVVKDSRVRGIEQGPQDGEREEVCEHEHRRGKGEEPRIVAEELVELRNSWRVYAVMIGRQQDP